ncbi:hypothetical protein LENED_012157 [Lentinula edodes]|uniref:Uncharacterized protein n=1 Tax=Lentinula edodes TaxID=5353 RepID=A0A1Q3ERV7_LENED|nr:hypothetical protein LENED_012157 [Lentinula edodes]
MYESRVVGWNRTRKYSSRDKAYVSFFVTSATQQMLSSNLNMTRDSVGFPSVDVLNHYSHRFPPFMWWLTVECTMLTAPIFIISSVFKLFVWRGEHLAGLEDYPLNNLKFLIDVDNSEVLYLHAQDVTASGQGRHYQSSPCGLLPSMILNLEKKGLLFRGSIKNEGSDLIVFQRSWNIFAEFSLWNNSEFLQTTLECNFRSQTGYSI